MGRCSQWRTQGLVLSIFDTDKAVIENVIIKFYFRVKEHSAAEERVNGHSNMNNSVALTFSLGIIRTCSIKCDIARLRTGSMAIPRRQISESHGAM
jgi:hypothetical protein